MLQYYLYDFRILDTGDDLHHTAAFLTLLYFYSENPFAQIAFWARIAYVPIYIAGIKYLRSLVWIVGVVGYGMMVAAML